MQLYLVLLKDPKQWYGGFFYGIEPLLWQNDSWKRKVNSFYLHSLKHKLDSGKHMDSIVAGGLFAPVPNLDPACFDRGTDPREAEGQQNYERRTDLRD